MKKHKLVALFLSALVPLSAFANINPGYYVGPGDGAMVVIRVLPGGKKAVLGSFDEYQGIGYKSKPTTPQRVRSATATTGQYPNQVGTIKSVGHGRYTLTMMPDQRFGRPICVFDITKNAKGLVITGHTPEKNCVEYHGASWGYGAGTNSLLKPYRMP